MKIGPESWAEDHGITSPLEGVRGVEVPAGFALVKAWVWTGDPLSVSTGSVFIKLLHLCDSNGESAFQFSIQRFYEDRRPPVRDSFMILDMTEADIALLLEIIGRNPLIVEDSVRVVEGQDAPF